MQIHSHKNLRRDYRDRACLLDEVSHVGWELVPVAKVGGLLPHSHRGFYEICYIANGSVEWWVGNTVYQVSRGEVYITHPYERHGGVNAVMHPCELYWIGIAFPSSKAMPGITLAETEVLAHDYATMQYRTFSGSLAIMDHFERILAEHQNPSSHGVLAARSALHELLVCILRDHAEYAKSPQARAPIKSPQIQEALAWMEKHLAEQFSIDEVAHAAGMGISNFHEQFLREMGFTPAEYRTRQRIHKAKLLLYESHLSIVDIAFELGFSTSQYFATVFKKLVGATPREYRKQVRDSENSELAFTTG